MDLVIEGRAYYKGKLQQCCIGIEHGRISKVRKVLKGERHLDYGTRLILPSAIDVHTHMREPGMTKKEDFATGTTAAAFGGVTCIFDMPNTVPPAIMRSDLLDKKSVIAKKAWVDYGLFGGVSDASHPMRTAKEVVGFKIFMSSTTGSVLVSEDKDIRRALLAIQPLNKVVSVHAEDNHMIGKGEVEDLKGHERNRPIGAEVSAIQRLSELDPGARINVCHVTSSAGADALKKGFTSEATPHHLLLDIESESRRKAYAKVNPPLRRRVEREALFKAFVEGRISMLASDHAPHTIEDKEQELFAAPSGCPGVETGFPVMMALTKHETLPLRRLIEAACEVPARTFGLNKGIIQPGKDADLMVLDPRDLRPIQVRKLHSKCGWSLFEGRDAIFPQAVFLRGSLLIEDGGLVGERSGRDVAARA
jgi:dihydroorotase